jgi:cell division protein FtsZ
MMKNTVVVGIGRAGCTIVSKLATGELIDIFYMHSQEAYLLRNNYDNKIAIETSETKDFGTNGEVHLGYNCAKYNKNKILSTLSGYKIIFIVSGLGGGTGSGATPYIAEILKAKGVLCLSLVSLPFDFEGERKRRVALSAYNKIKKSSDSIILIDNNKILESHSKINKGIFALSDDFISTVIYSLTSLISIPEVINIDIQAIKITLQEVGVSTVGFGTARGKNRATSATNKSIENAQIFRKFQTNNIENFIISIIAGMDMDINEFDEVGDVIRRVSADDAIVVVGTIIDPEMTDDFEVVVIASGFVDDLDTTSSNDIPCAEPFNLIMPQLEKNKTGISVFSYCSEILKQKYSGIGASIRVKRNNNSVTLIIESDSGIIDQIEKAVDVYGDVIIDENKR